MTNRTNFNK